MYFYENWTYHALHDYKKRKFFRNGKEIKTPVMRPKGDNPPGGRAKKGKRPDPGVDQLSLFL